MRMTSLGEALPEACLNKLTDFCNQVASGRLARQEGEEHKSIRLLLKERVLEPFRKDLEGLWDLDYLSWAVCYTIQKQEGIPLID